MLFLLQDVTTSGSSIYYLVCFFRHDAEFQIYDLVCDVTVHRTNYYEMDIKRDVRGTWRVNYRPDVWLHF